MELVEDPEWNPELFVSHSDTVPPEEGCSGQNKEDERPEGDNEHTGQLEGESYGSTSMDMSSRGGLTPAMRS